MPTRRAVLGRPLRRGGTPGRPLFERRSPVGRGLAHAVPGSLCICRTRWYEICTGGAGPSRKRFIPPAVPRRRGAGGGTGPPRELLPGRRCTQRSGESAGVFLSRRTADSRARHGKAQPGPPGCGKTTIVQHLSTEAGVPLLMLEPGKLGSKYIHETSQNIDAAFDYAESLAKENKPVLMFMDDADSMLMSRNSQSGSHTEEMASFLNRIQRAGDKNVIFVAATNKYDLLVANILCPLF